MKHLNFRGLTARLAMLALVLTFSFSEAFATHFRYGSINWTNVSGNTVQFQITQGWRWSAYGNPTVGSVVFTEFLNFGDGTSTSINITVTSVNIAEDWFFGSATIVKTYAGTGPYTAFSQSCCRISTLFNDADGSWRTEATINPGQGNNSPVTTVPPIINLQGSTDHQSPDGPQPRSISDSRF